MRLCGIVCVVPRRKYLHQNMRISERTAVKHARVLSNISCVRCTRKEERKKEEGREGGMVFDLLLNLFFIHKLVLKFRIRVGNISKRVI
jgi:hypothetical protein